MKRKQDFADKNDNKKFKDDDSDDGSVYIPEDDGSSSDSDSSSIYSDDIPKLNVFNENTVNKNLSTTIIQSILDHLDDYNDLQEFLEDYEQYYLNKEYDSDDIVEKTSNQITKELFLDILDEIRYENDYNNNFDVRSYLENKLELTNELNDLMYDTKPKNQVVLSLSLAPPQTMKKKNKT